MKKLISLLLLFTSISYAAPSSSRQLKAVTIKNGAAVLTLPVVSGTIPNASSVVQKAGDTVEGDLYFAASADGIGFGTGIGDALRMFRDFGGDDPNSIFIDGQTVLSPGLLGSAGLVIDDANLNGAGSVGQDSLFKINVSASGTGATNMMRVNEVDGGNNLLLLDVNGDLAIRRTVTAAKSVINGTSDTEQSKIKAHSTQTANLSEWLSNADAVLASVSPTGVITASSFVGPFTGNASTATALAANPVDCGANTFANVIAANGDLTCASIANAATTATSANTASAIVARDGSGDFSAGLGTFASGVKLKASGSGSSTISHYEEAAEQDLGTLVWTATVAPSGTINQKYKWTRTGRIVQMWVKIDASIAGTAVTAVDFPLPADMPAPAIFASQPASTVIAYGSGQVASTANPTISGASASKVYFDGSSLPRVTIESTVAVTGQFIWGYLSYSL